MPERLPITGPSSEHETVSIELSKEQVAQVLRDASATDSTSLLLAGLADTPSVLDGVSRLLENARLSRSLLSGLLLLAACPTDGGSVSLTELARLLGMSMSTAHRYVSTLVAVGLLERDSVTRRYRLAHAG